MNEREREIIEVSLDDIIPNRFQPRLSFDEQGLNELAESIRQHGIIQPLVLRKIGDKYEIIAGERRYKASYIAGLTKVPAVIIDLNDNESAEVAIVENIQRKDLSPIEEAKSYKKLLDRGYLTQDQLASRMGKNQSTVSNKLRLLNLDEKVQDALLNNKISERHARSLLKLDNKEEQKEVLDKIIEKRLNVRDTEDLINRKLNGEEEFINIPNLSNTGIEETFDFNNIPNVSNDYKNEEEIEKMPTFSSNPIKEYKENVDDIEVISDFDNDIINVPSLSIAKKEKNIDDVISKIQRVVEEVKELGFEAKLEEYDFDGLYQFVIKVDNEN